jgi:hypothetical protein
MDRATIDITPLLRNLHTKRCGESPAEYAQAIHHESLRRAAVWPERLMLFLAGVCAGATLILKALP